VIVESGSVDFVVGWVHDKALGIRVGIYDRVVVARRRFVSRIVREPFLHATEHFRK